MSHASNYYNAGVASLTGLNPNPYLTVDEFGAMTDWMNLTLMMKPVPENEFHNVHGMYCLFLSYWCDENDDELPMAYLE